MVKHIKGKGWCVLHSGPKKGPRDKPPGSIIKCHKTKAEALAHHRAIMLNKSKRKAAEFALLLALLKKLLDKKNNYEL